MNNTIETCMQNHHKRKARVHALNNRLLRQLIGKDVDWNAPSTLRKYETFLRGTNIERLFDNAIIANEYKQIQQSKKSKNGVTTEIPESWKTNITQFAQDALKVTLHPHQIELCESTARTNILIAGRGAGKSLAAMVKAIHKAVTCKNHTVLVVSSGQRMSSNFGENLLGLIRESVLMNWVASISKETVTFHNGSSLHLLPANPDTIRGYHPKPGHEHSGITAILDEACFMEQGAEIRKAIEYTLITTNNDDGQLLIVSSPTTAGSWVHEMAEQKDVPEADTRVFHCASSANPAITEEEIERLRATKNELEFRAEVLGEWVNGAYGLFAGVIEPNLVEAELILPPDALTSLGADLALSYTVTQDNNALAVAAKWIPKDAEDESEARYRIVELVSLPHASDHEIRETAENLSKKFNINAATVEQFQGKALAEQCQQMGIETELIAATTNQQRMVFHEMHRLLRQNLLELPKTLPQIFFDELNNFEYRMEKNGSVSFGHPPSSKSHDDTVYAAAWAIHALAFNPNLQCSQQKAEAPIVIGFIPKKRMYPSYEDISKTTHNTKHSHVVHPP